MGTNQIFKNKTIAVFVKKDCWMDDAWIWTTEKDGDDGRDAAFANLTIVIAYLEGETKAL